MSQQIRPDQFRHKQGTAIRSSAKTPLPIPLPLKQLVVCTLLMGATQLGFAEGAAASTTTVASPTAPTISDTIRIPVGQQGADRQDIAKPTLGMSMARVRNLFGEAQAEQAPRGTPPISRWEYDSFVVYFEKNTVIHTVIKK